MRIMLLALHLLSYISRTSPHCVRHLWQCLWPKQIKILFVPFIQISVPFCRIFKLPKIIHLNRHCSADGNKYLRIDRRRFADVKTIPSFGELAPTHTRAHAIWNRNTRTINEANGMTICVDLCMFARFVSWCVCERVRVALPWNWNKKLENK